MLLRLIRCVHGQAQVRMYCNPVFDYGRHPAQWEYAGEGYHEALASAEGAERSLRLTTEAGRTSAEVDRTPWFVPAGQADRPG